MKLRIPVVLWIASVLGLACAHTGSSFDEQDLGLSKTSVFDTPSPGVFAYTDADPEDVDKLPRSFPGAPPLIPHEIKSMTPIMASDNQCLECHDKPRYIGKDIKDKSPMSKGHYAVVKEKVTGWELSGARFNCTQCHVMQSDAEPLVSNTFVNVEE